jgi:hypothetical protein
VTKQEGNGPLDGRVIFKMRRSDMDWIDLDQDKEQGRVLANTVMNLRLP